LKDKGGQVEKDRRQKTGDRSQRAEDRSQKSGDRRGLEGWRVSKKPERRRIWKKRVQGFEDSRIRVENPINQRKGQKGKGERLSDVEEL